MGQDAAHDSVVTINEALGALGLSDIAVDPDVPKKGLEGEGLSNTGDASRLLTSWIGKRRRGVRIERQADFYFVVRAVV